VPVDLDRPPVLLPLFPSADWERYSYVKFPSPKVGEGGDGGEGALVPPPPEPSPIKGEGQFTSPSELSLQERGNTLRAQAGSTAKAIVADESAAAMRISAVC
jgi:hypothetical protein